MSKIFHIPKGVRHKTHAHPLARDRWFGSYQPLLLRMLRTDTGRDLLGVDRSLPPIDQVSHRHVRCLIDERPGRIRSWVPAMQGWGSVPGVDRTYRSEFRIGEKFANVIRFRWKAYLAYAAYLEAQQYDYHRARASALGVPLIAGGAVTTVYPDPHPESATTDGTTRRVASAATWATIRGAAGTGGAAANSVNNPHWIARVGGGSPGWSRLQRGWFSYDTSSLGDGDTIDGGVLSLYDAGSVNSTNGTSVVITGIGTLASATDVVSGDHVNRGSTSQSDTTFSLSAFDSGGYNDFVLNSTGLGNISKTGVSGPFNLLSSADRDGDTEPGSSAGDDWITCAYAEETGTSSDPKLVITHTSPFIPKALVY
jgi:hypothetical protein